MRGTIVRITNRGFGFIRPDEGAAEGDAFFLFSEMSSPVERGEHERLLEMRIEFDLVKGERGLRAKNIRPAD